MSGRLQASPRTLTWMWTSDENELKTLTWRDVRSWMLMEGVEESMLPGHIFVRPSTTFPGTHVYGATLTFQCSVRTRYVQQKLYSMKSHVPEKIHPSQFVFVQCWSGLDVANHLPQLPEADEADEAHESGWKVW